MKQFGLLDRKWDKAVAGDSYALLAVQNRQLAMDLAMTGAKCAHFRAANCFERHSPHETAL